jgi:hypothetical protein
MGESRDYRAICYLEYKPDHRELVLDQDIWQEILIVVSARFGL